MTPEEFAAFSVGCRYKQIQTHENGPHPKGTPWCYRIANIDTRCLPENCYRLKEPVRSSKQQKMFEESGCVTGTRLEAFIYLLIRDHVPTSVVAEIVNSIDSDESTFTNGWLGQYAKYVVRQFEED